MLVDEGLIYKKRGVGMFVSENAREVLIGKRHRQLICRYVKPLLDEAVKLGVSLEELLELLKKTQSKKTL